MAKMYEFLNPQSHTIQLSSPDKRIIKIPARGKVILPEWFKNYCPKYLRIVREVGSKKTITPKRITPNTTKYDRSNGKTTKPRIRKPTLNPSRQTKIIEVKNHRKERAMRSQVPVKISGKRPNKQIVGRKTRESGAELFHGSLQNNKWTVSNNIGIGILSYNRLQSLQRLINSIRAHTNLSRTTVFVSDESTDNSTKAWLKKQSDIVVLTDQERLGIAGNGNRLLRCLSRFKYGILLNDDVEILQNGWDEFYSKASASTKIHHFCYRQPGIYGAKRNGKRTKMGAYHIETIAEKPHGAVMFFTNEMFSKIGYFDERFGRYGIEHVDWSQRASDTGMQAQGFHDVIGAEKFFKIHQEKSAVENRSKELQKARAIYRTIANPKVRVHVEATKRSRVPSISVVIPIKNIDRQGATEVVVNSIRSQLYPNIEIIIAEQDIKPNFNLANSNPCRYFFSQSKHKNQPFTKAMAFNLGVSNASNEKIVLQDADICCSSIYIKKISDLLDDNDGIHIGSRVLYMSKEATAAIVGDNRISADKYCERAVGYFEGGSLACTKKSYFKCGGFDEIYEGYGIEDCDFFDRLKYHSKFFNTRSEDLVHLWHGRTKGWEVHHRRNKKIFQQLRKQYNMNSHTNMLIAKLKELYPKTMKELGL